MFNDNVYKNQPSRQTGSRNLMGPKTLTTIWGTDIKLVTKNQICVINSCWEKCDEKCAYMFNVYKNQLSRQTGSRNLTGPKTLPTIWHIYMKLVTKYQISAINSCWEKYLGRTDRGSRGIINEYKQGILLGGVTFRINVRSFVSFTNSISSQSLLCPPTTPIQTLPIS